MTTEAPDLFLHLSRSDLVFFKGDLNHRKLTYDCAAPASTPFEEAIGPMANAAGAPKVCSLRTIKSDVVVGLESDAMAEKLDKEEPGWKISGKYVSISTAFRGPMSNLLFVRLSCCCQKGDPAKKFASHKISLEILVLKQGWQMHFDTTHVNCLSAFYSIYYIIVMTFFVYAFYAYLFRFSFPYALSQLCILTTKLLDITFSLSFDSFCHYSQL